MNNLHINVLLIEDNPGDARLIELLLNEVHHEQCIVTLAKTLAEGKVILTEYKPDVVLLDLSLPDSQGLETLDEVMAVAAPIPVIVLTGLDDETIGLEAINKGSQDYLVKGDLDGRMLARAIRYAIERNQADQDLLRSETQFRLLSENTPAGVYMIQNYVFTYVNPAMARMFGYTRDEMLGKAVLDVASSDDYEKIEKNIAIRLKGEVDIIHYEFTGIRKDGSEFDCEVIGGTFIQNDILTIIGTLRDVSGRNAAQKTLDDERTLLRTLIDNLPDLIYAKDLDTRFTLSNIANARIVGIDSAHKLLGKSDQDVHPQETASQYLIDDKQVLETGEPVINKEERIVDSQGNSRWIRTTKVPLLNQAGEITGLVGIGHDITKRKQMDEALRVSEERFRILSELSSDYAYSIVVHEDGTSRIEWATQAFTDITGYTPEEADASGRWQSIVHADDLDSVAERVKGLYSGQPDTREYRIINKAGETRWIHEHCLPIWDVSQERVVRIYGTVQDITERKGMEVRLTESERFARATVNALSAHIAILDENGTIVSVNDAWLNFALANSQSGSTQGLCEGANYLDVVRAVLPTSEEAEVAKAVSDAIEQIIRGEMDTFSMEYSCHSPGEQRWFVARITHFVGDGPKRIVIAHENITERVLAATALRKSEIRYRQLVEDQVDLVFRYDADGKLTFGNRAYCEHMGVTAAELPGKSIFDGIPVEDREQARAHLHALTRDNPVAISVHRTILPDQRIRWFEWKDRAIFDDQGNLIEFQGIGRDITEQKQAEEALRASEERYRVVSELVSDYAFAYQVNVDGTIQQEWIVEDSFFRATGYTPEENSRQGTYSLYHPDEVSHAEQDVQRVIHGEPVSGEYRVITKGGAVRWLRISRRPVWDDQKQRVIRFFGVAQDISEQKQAEEALRASEKRYREVAELISDYAYAYAVQEDGDLQCEWVVGGFEAVTGYTMAEVEIFGCWTYLTHPDDKGIATKRAGHLMAGEQDISEFRIVRKDGDIRWLRDHGHPVWDAEAGRVVRVYGAVQDITDRKRAEEHLRLEAETQAAILRLLDSDTPNQDAFIDAALDEALILTNSQIGYFHIISPDGVSLNLFAWSKGVDDRCTAEKIPHYPLDQAGVWADCVRMRRSVIHNDYPGLLMASSLPDGHIPLVRHMSVPILDRGEVVAVIGVGNKEGLYTEADSIRLTLMSSTLWSWIQRKRAESLIERQNRNLGILNRVISISSSTLEVTRVLDITCRELATTFDAIRVMAATWDEKRKVFQVAMDTDGTAQESRIDAVFMEVNDPILDYLARYNIPLVVDESNQAKYPHYQRADWCQTALFLPLRVRSQMHGVFWIAFDQPRLFSDVDISLAASIIQAISQTFENSLLHQQVTDQNIQLSDKVAQRTAQLQHMNERLTTILNNVSDAILLLDMDNHIRNTNLAFNRMFEYAHDELFDQLIDVLVEPDRLAALRQTLDTVRETRQSQRLETPVLTKKGRTFDGDIALAFVKDNGGHMVCSIRDISHLKEVEQVKDRFVSMVSHELRTPISSILLSSNTLESHYDRLTEEQKRRKLSQIASQADRLAHLVTSILDVSRFDARQGRRGEDLVDVAQALQDVVAEMNDQAVAKQHRLYAQYYNEVMTVRGDYIDVARVWRNLLSNAVKYTDVGGEIRLTAYGGAANGNAPEQLPNLAAFADSVPMDWTSGRYIIGLVEDNGHGIRPEDMDQLFTRFFRGWASGTNITGTGLGLSLVRDLLRLHGGDIAVRSVLNTGTSFCFWLPIELSKGDTQ